MALMLGKATQECGLKHRQPAVYRCTNVWQTTLWEVQKARVFPSPLMVIMHGFRFFISTSFNPASTAFFFTLLALVEWSAGRTRNPDVLGSNPALATLDLFFGTPS